MKNICDIRDEKNLLFMFSTTEGPNIDKVPWDASALVINLFYEDSVEKYGQYIGELSKKMDVYVFSSNVKVLEALHAKSETCRLLQKDNRGRDVSALLVAFKPYLDKYKYICFVHDKKHKSSKTKNDTDIWNWNIWGNTVFNDIYVSNVLYFFENNSNIGLAVPPEPLGEYNTAWYTNAWYENFKNCCELSDKLKLVCDIDKNKSPLALSSVFWARVDAIKKIYEIDWQYEDFPQEPMKNDGTISHAIERIWGFLAQDAGYEVATVMNEGYARWELLRLQRNTKEMFALLSREMNIHNLNEVSTYDERLLRVKEFVEKNEEVYIYGAGKFGKDLLYNLERRNISVAGFCVTDDNYKNQQIDGKKLFKVTDVIKKNAGIIVAVNIYFQDEIIENIKKYDYDNFVVAY